MTGSVSLTGLRRAEKLRKGVLGTLVCTRLPSGSRASTQGDDSSTRRSSEATIRPITCRAGAVAEPQAFAFPFMPPRALKLAAEGLRG